jgi:hypothetical protein
MPKPILYYLPSKKGGPVDLTGKLKAHVHLVEFGNKVTCSSGQFNGRVIVYSHGSKAGTIRVGPKPFKHKGKPAGADKNRIKAKEFYENWFQKAFSKILGKITFIELAVCYTGKSGFLSEFSEALPQNLLQQAQGRGPMDEFTYFGDKWKIGPSDGKGKDYAACTIVQFFREGNISDAGTKNWFIEGDLAHIKTKVERAVWKGELAKQADDSLAYLGGLFG